MKVEILKGNIIETDAEVIVNAANTDLILGGGVAGAIRRAGGPRIQQECNALAPIRCGEIAVTSAGDLPQRYVFHAATMTLQCPQTSKEIVEACTRAALEKAEHLRCKSIAFPALGTGVAGLDLRECADAMFGAVQKFAAALPAGASLERVVFILFDEEAYRIFSRRWEEINQT